MYKTVKSSFFIIIIIFFNKSIPCRCILTISVCTHCTFVRSAHSSHLSKYTCLWNLFYIFFPANRKFVLICFDNVIMVTYCCFDVSLGEKYRGDTLHIIQYNDTQQGNYHVLKNYAMCWPHQMFHHVTTLLRCNVLTC